MIITTYKCDACEEECKHEDIYTISSFPRRTYKYVKDTHGNKIVGFPDITFAETHLCDLCYHKMLNFTRKIDE